AAQARNPLGLPLPLAMESRRLVVWISTGILGFQGLTLCFDLLNCTALSWLYVRLHGFDAAVQRSVASAPEPALQRPRGRGGVLDPDAPTPPVAGSVSSLPVHPLALFCARPQGRIDDAVSQGLSILAGLALGGSMGSDRGRGEP
ncbi:hypothetical protein, partial [Vulcanococcus limneticus]|uniref:hypothetical protein n=3 Tax=Vulcanococcus limneticus TaxID=2170428 RepID=UPI0020CCAA98